MVINKGGGCTWEDTWIILERGNKIDFVGELGTSGDGNRREQIGEKEWEKKIQEETTTTTEYLKGNGET